MSDFVPIYPPRRLYATPEEEFRAIEMSSEACFMVVTREMAGLPPRGYPRVFNQPPVIHARVSGPASRGMIQHTPSPRPTTAVGPIPPLLHPSPQRDNGNAAYHKVLAYGQVPDSSSREPTPVASTHGYPAMVASAQRPVTNIRQPGSAQVSPPPRAFTDLTRKQRDPKRIAAAAEKMCEVLAVSEPGAESEKSGDCSPCTDGSDISIVLGSSYAPVASLATDEEEQAVDPIGEIVHAGVVLVSDVFWWAVRKVRRAPNVDHGMV